MIHPILKYGDRGLQQPASPVDAVTDEVRTLIDDMIQTMYAAPGVGLAAPQIGVDRRVFVIDVSVGQSVSELLALVNPQFESRDGMQLEEEGCLSLPGFSATVARPACVVVTGLDRDGQPLRIEGSDLLARALQHEMDHLDGTLFVDRLRGIKRDVIVRRIGKLRRTGKW